MNKLWKLAIGWGALTVIFGTIFVVAQQLSRQLAYEPQIQLSEDYASRPFVDKIDIATSLAPFVVIYDTNGVPTSGSGYLNNELPNLPSGVFAYTRDHDQDRVTWEPQKGVRIASVVTYKNMEFVLAGRSMREVENRAQKLLELVGFGWLVTMVGFSFGILAAQTLRKK